MFTGLHKILHKVVKLSENLVQRTSAIYLDFTSAFERRDKQYNDHLYIKPSVKFLVTGKFWFPHLLTHLLNLY